MNKIISLDEVVNSSDSFELDNALGIYDKQENSFSKEQIEELEESSYVEILKKVCDDIFLQSDQAVYNLLRIIGLVCEERKGAVKFLKFGIINSLEKISQVPVKDETKRDNCFLVVLSNLQHFSNKKNKIQLGKKWMNVFLDKFFDSEDIIIRRQCMENVTNLIQKNRENKDLVLKYAVPGNGRKSMGRVLSSFYQEIENCGDFFLQGKILELVFRLCNYKKFKKNLLKKVFGENVDLIESFKAIRTNVEFENDVSDFVFNLNLNTESQMERKVRSFKCKKLKFGENHRISPGLVHFGETCINFYGSLPIPNNVEIDITEDKEITDIHLRIVERFELQDSGKEIRIFVKENIDGYEQAFNYKTDFISIFISKKDFLVLNKEVINEYEKRIKSGFYTKKKRKKKQQQQQQQEEEEEEKEDEEMEENEENENESEKVGEKEDRMNIDDENIITQQIDNPPRLNSLTVQDQNQTVPQTPNQPTLPQNIRERLATNIPSPPNQYHQQHSQQKSPIINPSIQAQFQIQTQKQKRQQQVNESPLIFGKSDEKKEKNIPQNDSFNISSNPLNRNKNRKKKRTFSEMKTLSGEDPEDDGYDAVDDIPGFLDSPGEGNEDKEFTAICTTLKRLLVYRQRKKRKFAEKIYNETEKNILVELKNFEKTHLKKKEKMLKTNKPKILEIENQMRSNSKQIQQLYGDFQSQLKKKMNLHKTLVSKLNNIKDDIVVNIQEQYNEEETLLQELSLNIKDKIELMSRKIEEKSRKTEKFKQVEDIIESLDDIEDF